MSALLTSSARAQSLAMQHPDPPLTAVPLTAGGGGGGGGGLDASRASGRGMSSPSFSGTVTHLPPASPIRAAGRGRGLVTADEPAAAMAARPGAATAGGRELARAAVEAEIRRLRVPAATAAAHVPSPPHHQWEG